MKKATVADDMRLGKPPRLWSPCCQDGLMYVSGVKGQPWTVRGCPIEVRYCPFCGKQLTRLGRESR